VEPLGREKTSSMNSGRSSTSTSGGLSGHFDLDQAQDAEKL
jgi:hypothetical protein